MDIVGNPLLDSSFGTAVVSATDFPKYKLDISHGLGSNQIQGVAQDSMSRIWLASPVGLARFDGSFTRQWARHSGLQCNGLRCVSIDAQGYVWVGTDLGFELLDEDGNAQPGIDTVAWRFGLCECIDVSGADPWIGCALGLVKLKRGADGVGLRIVFAADIGFVSDLVRLDERSLLAASSSHGIVETDGMSWWRYRCEGIMGRQISRIATGTHGELLVGTDDGLILLDRASRRVNGILRLERGDPQVTAIAAGAKQHWVAFGRTLVACVFGTSGFEVVERFEVESQVNDLLIDELGNVWIATDNSGLAQVSCLRHAIRRIEIGRQGAVHSIKQGNDSTCMLGGDHLFGKIVLTPDQDRAALSRVEGLPETIVWDSLEGDDGTWVATQAGLYHAPNGGAFIHAHAQDAVLGAPNRVIIRRDGDLWVGTLRGLARLRDGRAHSIEALGSSLGYVYAMLLDELDCLWIGTLGRGLWREKEGLHAITTGPLSENGNTYAIARAPDGRTIIVQDENIILIDTDDSARIVARLPPVAGWTAIWVDAGTIAVGSSDGLRLVDIDSGRIKRHVQSYFRLRDWEFTNNRTLVRDSQGRFLCGLTSGLARVDMDRLSSYPAPSCKLVDIKWTGAVPVTHKDALRIRPGRWSFLVRACSAWFVDSSLVRFQFQLVGFDMGWSPLRERLEATYTSLPPGKYRLLARAYAPLTGFGPETELLELEVNRPMWTVGWGAALAFLGLAYDWLVRSQTRNQALLDANRELEMAVAERTRSLHEINRELEAVRDTYQRLSEVDELTQLGNRRNFDKEIVRAIALANRLDTPLSLLMVDIDHFKSVNDRHGHQVGDEYLRSVAGVLESNVRKGEDVATRFGGEEFAILLVSKDSEGAALSAERMRNAVSNLQLTNDGSQSGFVTISIGVAAMPAGKLLSPEELLARADRALYKAKFHGRNRVEVDR